MPVEGAMADMVLIGCTAILAAGVFLVLVLLAVAVLKFINIR